MVNLTDLRYNSMLVWLFEESGGTYPHASHATVTNTTSFILMLIWVKPCKMGGEFVTYKFIPYKIVTYKFATEKFVTYISVTGTNS